jgi:ribonuclease Y
MITIQMIIATVVGIVLGVFIGLWTRKRIVEKQFESINSYSKKIINEAQREAKTIKKEAMLRAKDTLYQMKLDFEKETKEKKGQLQSQERRLFHKEENLDKKIDQYENREKSIEKREIKIKQTEDDLKRKQTQYDELITNQRYQLERLAGISSKEAKELLIISMESEAKHDAAKLIRKIENEAKETSKRKSQEILALAIKRYAGDYVTEKTVSVVNLPNEEMKGRIIGREGRNIRAIEAATGIDLIIDDTPEAVILSGFNPVRRAMAGFIPQELKRWLKK